jgi:hypothetical protein
MAGIVPKDRRWMRNVAIPLLLVELFMFADLEGPVAGAISSAWGENSVVALPLGPHHELLLDASVIQEMKGIVRKVNQPKRRADNPIFAAEKPWEGKAVYLYGSVLKSPASGVWQMWYQCFNRDAPTLERSFLCYATSPDGIHDWSRPSLGQIEYRGSKENNIFYSTGYRDTHSASIVLDPRPRKDAERYRLFCWDVKPAPGLQYAWSPDGVRWTYHPQNPVWTGIGDVPVTIWDNYSKKFLCYAKVSREVLHRRRRTIAVGESEDGVHWTEPKVVLQPDELDPYDTDFYGMAVLPYKGLYLGFLWVYHTDRRRDVIDVQLAFSRSPGDGWTRVTSIDRSGQEERAVFLPLGERDSWEDGMVFINNSPAVFDDHIRLYYSGCGDLHDQAGTRHGSIGIAELPVDRFVFLEAQETGYFGTVPVLWKGEQLFVNADSRGGEIRVGVLDSEKNPVAGFDASPCDPISADSLRHRVSWQGKFDLRSFNGRPVRLEFRMTRAKLYSFSIEG